MKVATTSKTAFLKLQAQRKLERSALAVKESFETLESSNDAEALKKVDFNPPPIYPERSMPIAAQMRELNGLNLKNVDSVYKNLIE